MKHTGAEPTWYGKEDPFTICFILNSQIIHDLLDNLPIYEGEPGFFHLFFNKCIAYDHLRSPTFDHDQKKTFFRKRYRRKCGKSGQGWKRSIFNNKYPNFWYFKVFISAKCVYRLYLAYLLFILSKKRILSF